MQGQTTTEECGMDDDDDTGGLPALAWIAIGLLVVIGLFTIVGWAFSLVWTMIRIAVLVVILAGLWAAFQSVRKS